MAKRKGDSDSWDDVQVCALHEAMIEGARQHFGGERKVVTGSEAAQSIVGPPLPALCLRYLFQSTVLPLGRCVHIFGKPGSCKSAMLYELFRWHRLVGGMATLNETENKEAPELLSSVLQYDLTSVNYHYSDQIEDWMKAVSFYIRRFKDLCNGTKGKPGYGRRAAYAIGIDSLMALVSSETLKKFAENDGAPERRFGIEAGKISDFFRTNAPEIRGWPITLAYTNHQKQDIGANVRPGMPPPDRMPGGEAPRFYATYEIKMSKIGDVVTAEHDGIHCKLVMAKNSLGPSRKVIEAELLWVTENLGPGLVVQRTIWDWDRATIDLLLGLQNRKLKKTWNAVKEIIDLHPLPGKRLWSSALGIDRESPVSYRTAGAMLEKRPDLLEPLHAALGVKEHLAFYSNADYGDLLEKAQARAQEHQGAMLEAMAARGAYVFGEQAGEDEDDEADAEEAGDE